MSNLCIYGAKVLREVAVPIEEFTGELVDFAEELIEKMYLYDGVGLAAPQIGISKRVIAIDVSEAGDSPIVIVNPEIVESAEETCSEAEGCLSVPGIRALVDRPEWVTVKGYSPEGKALLFEKCVGLFGRALQHEIDHLDGVLFVDKVSAAKKALLRGKLKKMANNSSK